MELNFMTVCGSIACVLMLWWALAVFYFTIRYERNDRVKVLTSSVMLVCAAVIMIMDVVKLFGGTF